MKVPFILFFSFCLSFSQNVSKKLDSLQLVLKNKSLSHFEKVEVLNGLSSNYAEFDFDKAIFYNNQLFSISKREKYHKGLGYYYKNLADINFFKRNFKEAEKMAKKAQNYFLRANEINNYLLSIYANCFALEFQGEAEKAKKLVLFTIQRYEKIPKNERIAELYYYLSTIYSDENKPKLAFFYVNKALDLYKNQKLENGIIKSNFHLSYICYSNRMYKKSIFYLNYCDKTVKAKFNHKIDYHINNNYLYARNYVKLKQYKKALFYCKLTEKYRKQLNLQNEFVGDKLILIEIYTKLKNYSKALEYINKVKASELDYQDEEFEFSLLKGKYYLAINNYKEAYRIAKENYLLRPLDTENLQLLSASLIANGDYKNAYFYQSKILMEKDKNFEIDKDNRITEYEALFQLKEKDLTINNKNLQVAKQESEIQKQKSYVVISIVILIALLSVFVLFVNSYQIKRKSNQILNSKNEELNQLNHLLNDSLKEKEVLLKEIHHRVKNNLQLVMSLLNIQAQDSQQVSIEDFLEKGQLRIATMSLIHQHLYLSDNFSNIDFQTYLQTLVENIKNTFSESNIPIDINTNGNTFDLDTAIPLGLIINEIVCNALKHAFPEDMVGRIQISIQKKDSNLFELLIGDNGIGSKELKKTNSIGLELVSLLVMQLRGKIERINQLGTNYSIEFKQSIEY